MAKWTGFAIPNTTPTPNQFYDSALARIDNLAELKCVLYVIRRTYGFAKLIDRIAYSQFVNGITCKDGKVLDEGTGLSGPSVNTGLQKAIKHKYLARYLICPHCLEAVTDKVILEYTMIPRNAKEPVTVSKEAPPYLCPHCDKVLRGNEEIYYSLCFENDKLDYTLLKSLVYRHKEFNRGLSKLFNTQEIVLQETVTREQPKSKTEPSNPDYLDLVLATKARQDKHKLPITYLSETVADLLGLSKVPNHKFDELWESPLSDLLDQADGDIERVEAALRAAVLEGRDGGITMTTPNSLHGLALQKLADRDNGQDEAAAAKEASAKATMRKLAKEHGHA